MLKFLIVAPVLVALTTPLLAAGTHGGSHEDAMAVGQPGAARDVDRTIEVTMVETDEGLMLFQPDTLTFDEGETVRIVIANTGYLEHEFVLDTVEKNIEHKELMERFPEMEHADPNAVRVQPGETGEILWTFANEGVFEFACLIPGHYEAGMHGPLIIN